MMRYSVILIFLVLSFAFSFAEDNKTPDKNAKGLDERNLEKTYKGQLKRVFVRPYACLEQSVYSKGIDGTAHIDSRNDVYSGSLYFSEKTGVLEADFAQSDEYVPVRGYYNLEDDIYTFSTKAFIYKIEHGNAQKVCGNPELFKRCCAELPSYLKELVKTGEYAHPYLMDEAYNTLWCIYACKDYLLVSYAFFITKMGTKYEYCIQNNVVWRVPWDTLTPEYLLNIPSPCYYAFPAIHPSKPIFPYCEYQEQALSRTWTEGIIDLSDPGRKIPVNTIRWDRHREDIPFPKQPEYELKINEKCNLIAAVDYEASKIFLLEISSKNEPVFKRELKAEKIEQVEFWRDDLLLRDTDSNMSVLDTKSGNICKMMNLHEMKFDSLVCNDRIVIRRSDDKLSVFNLATVKPIYEEIPMVDQDYIYEPCLVKEKNLICFCDSYGGMIYDYAKDELIGKIILPLDAKQLDVKYNAENDSFDVLYIRNRIVFSQKVTVEQESLKYSKPSRMEVPPCCFQGDNINGNLFKALLTFPSLADFAKTHGDYRYSRQKNGYHIWRNKADWDKKIICDSDGKLVEDQQRLNEFPEIVDGVRPIPAGERTVKISSPDKQITMVVTRDPLQRKGDVLFFANPKSEHLYSYDLKTRILLQFERNTGLWMFESIPGTNRIIVRGNINSAFILEGEVVSNHEYLEKLNKIFEVPKPHIRH